MRDYTWPAICHNVREKANPLEIDLRRAPQSTFLDPVRYLGTPQHSRSLPHRGRCFQPHPASVVSPLGLPATSRSLPQNSRLTSAGDPGSLAQQARASLSLLPVPTGCHLACTSPPPSQHPQPRHKPPRLRRALVDGLACRLASTLLLSLARTSHLLGGRLLIRSSILPFEFPRALALGTFRKQDPPPEARLSRFAGHSRLSLLVAPLLKQLTPGVACHSLPSRSGLPSPAPGR